MVWLGGVERCAGHKGHALVDGAPGEFGAVVHLAARPREARPHEQAALGLHKLDGVPQLLAQRIAHGLCALGVHLAHMGQRGGHAAGLEVLRGRGLGKGAGVCIAELLAHGGFAQQLGGGNHPAHAQAGRQHLAQAAAVHQQIAAAGHGGRQVEQAGRWRIAKVQIAIGVVFDHHSFVFHSEFEHAQAALEIASFELSYTRMTAPQDGMIGERAVRVGAYVTPGSKLLAVVPAESGITLVAGKRKMTIKAADLAHYVGERGRRGNKLPRGLQRIDEVLVNHTDDGSDQTSSGD